MATDAALKAPVLLLAMPQVLDPFFQRSVVLLIHHDEEGSFGFIVNRPMDIRVTDILHRMEIDWQGDPGEVVHFGGPVQTELGSILFTPTEVTNGDGAEPEGAAEVLPGLAITQHVGDLAKLAATPPKAFRMFLGYAGWGSSQLIDEILRNDWLTAPVSPELVFGAEGAASWEDALRSVGIDPGSLPAWTSPGGGDTSTN